MHLRDAGVNTAAWSAHMSTLILCPTLFSDQNGRGLSDWSRTVIIVSLRAVLLVLKCAIKCARRTEA